MEHDSEVMIDPMSSTPARRASERCRDVAGLVCVSTLLVVALAAGAPGAAAAETAAARSDTSGGRVFVATDGAFRFALPAGWVEASDATSEPGTLRFTYGARSDIELIVTLGKRRPGLEDRSLLELVRADLEQQGGSAHAVAEEVRVGQARAVRVRRSTAHSEELHVIYPTGQAVFQFAYLTPNVATFESQRAAIEAAIATVIPSRALDPSDAAARKQRYLEGAADLSGRGDYGSASALLDDADSEFPDDAEFAATQRRLAARALVMPALSLSNQVIDPQLDVSALAAAPQPRVSFPSPPAEVEVSVPVSTPDAAEDGGGSQTEALTVAPPEIPSPAGVSSNSIEAVRSEIDTPTETVVAVAPPTPPASVPSTDPVLTLQVGAFRSVANAESLRARVSKSIPEAYVTEADVEGARIYRVRVGRFGSLGAARAAQNTLRAAGYDCVMLPATAGD